MITVRASSLNRLKDCLGYAKLGRDLKARRGPDESQEEEGNKYTRRGTLIHLWLEKHFKLEPLPDLRQRTRPIFSLLARFSL